MSKRTPKSSENKPDPKLKQKIVKHKPWQRDKVTHRMLYIQKPPFVKIV